MTRIIIGRTFAKLEKKLYKKFPRVFDVVDKLIAQLQNGDLPGDRIQGLSKVVYKVRLPNPDAQRGKRGGYRVIYYIKTEDKVALLLIYTKFEIDDMPTSLIEKTIDEVENLLTDD